MERYNAHPIDLYRYALPLMLIGCIAIGYGDGFGWIGVALVVLGFLTGCWTIATGITREYIDAKQAFSHTAKILNQTKSPEVWRALGVDPPSRSEPAMFQSAPTQYKFKQVGWTKLELTSLANGVLRGEPFTEDYWTSERELVSGKKFRKLHHALKEDTFIKPKNKTNPRMGYEFTRKGRDGFLLRYANPDLVQGLTQDRAPAPGERLTASSPLLREGA